jgi:ribosomal protein S18 acetylase RimI-like enzyme
VDIPLRKATVQRLEVNASELAHTIESIEAEAWLDWIAAAPPALVQSHGIETLRVAGAVAGMAPGTDVLMYNRVVGLGIVEPATHADVDALISAYTGAGVQRWMVQWSPAALPRETVDLMRACGFYHHNNWAKLYRSTRAPLPEIRTELRIERTGGEQRDAFASILAQAFGHERELAEWNAALIDRPGWRAYMAFAGDEPVATGALFVHGRTAWLGFGATLPSYRGRGAQSALAALRITAARELGCDAIVLETAEDLPAKPSQSYRNMRRLGFEVAYLRPNYVMIAGTPAVGLVVERRPHR